MAAKPHIAIVGAGKLASTLGIWLQRSGYKIDAIIARARRPSLKNARRVARELGAGVLTDDLRKLRADIVWFCVPDAAIASVAKNFSEQWKWKGKIALHSSGALTSDELYALRRRGAAVASVHPMMTFVRPVFSGKSKSGLQRSNYGMKQPLAGVPFAVEGDASAVRVARRIVGDLSGVAYPIRKSDKAAYHAWGTFASPLLTALLVTTEKVAALAGVEKNAARKRMIPILLQTISNYATRDTADAFSGPIIRGDVDTVQRHLRVLHSVPTAWDVYVALAQAAIRYLPAGNKRTLIRLLEAEQRARESKLK